jgi:glucokinase
MKEVSVGIDIGGTNSAYGIVDGEGNILIEGTISTKDHPKVENFVKAMHKEIQKSISSIDKKIKVSGIGIGAPNGNFYNGTIESAPNLDWKGIVPLKELFEQYDYETVVVTNDANAAAIGEKMFGGARYINDFIMITLGTGLGSGIVVDGDLVYGHDGFAGEIGHTFVYMGSGRKCGCGRKGCLETYVSATGIKRTAFELMANSTKKSELRNLSFNELTSTHIYEAAKNADPIALKAFENTGKLLGIKLADAVAHTSPQAIFLFGGLAKADEYIFNPTRKHFEDNVLGIFRNKVKILPSELNEKNGAILGAAALVWKKRK